MKLIIISIGIILIFLGIIMLTAPNLIVSLQYYQWTNTWAYTIGGLVLIAIGVSMELIIYLKTPQH